MGADKKQNQNSWKVIHKLYEWIMSWAGHRHGVKALAFISAIESIFFPLPVDPLLLAMGAGKPKKALHFALITTIASVIGGLLGYGIGILFWEHTQELFFQYVFSQDKMTLVLEKFRENGFLAIFLAGFTPIPFKVFTITAGVANLSIPAFIAASFIGRGLRFGILGFLLYKYGDSIREYIERNFKLLTTLLGLAVVLVFVVYKFLTS